MRTPTPSTRRASPSPTPDQVVTYRRNNKMIYVPLAKDFDQAVTFARSAFERDLSGVDKSRISFSLNVLANGKQSSVGISPVAWQAVGSRLARYEIIDVHIQPEITVSPPPSYQSHSSMDGAEKELHCSSRPSSRPSSQPSPPPSSHPRRLFQRLSS